MTKKSINWEKIKGLMTVAAFFGAVATAVNFVVKEETEKQVVRNATSVTTPDEKTITSLISPDVVQIRTGDLIHIFNFNYLYVIATGKIDDLKIDASFSFSQFDNKVSIEDARKQGCTIAATSMQNLADSITKESVQARDTATLFARKHCPQQAPAP